MSTSSSSPCRASHPFLKGGACLPPNNAFFAAFFFGAMLLLKLGHQDSNLESPGSEPGGMPITTMTHCIAGSEAGLPILHPLFPYCATRTSWLARCAIYGSYLSTPHRTCALPAGLEPTTSRLTVGRSAVLSYGRVDVSGVEPELMDTAGYSRRPESVGASRPGEYWALPRILH